MKMKINLCRQEKDKELRRANRVILLLAVMLAAFVTCFAGYRLNMKAEAGIQQHLAQEVLRFHILANSDSEEDQELKMTVKAEVLDFLEAAMPEQQDVSETKDWIRRHIDDIEDLCRKTVEETGADYPVNAVVTTCWFPEKTYGDVTFPQGNYEALRIEIGAAQGHNWWCVLYPGLCFLDAANGVVPGEGKQKLKNVLTEEEYSHITAEGTFQIAWYFPSLFGGKD